jgi:hypothetical protein
VQIGVEATPGTSVAANKKLLSIGIGPSVSVDPQRFRAMGNKYYTVVVPGKEWVEADLEGVGSYSELAYILAANIAAPTSAQQGATTAYKHTYVSATSAEDTIKSFTVEQGGAIRAHKFTYGIIPEVELTFNRDGIEVGGSMLGQRLQDNITLTASPTSLEEKPILPADVDVFSDATSGGLGTTKLLRVLEATVTLGDRFNPVWVLDSTKDSFVAHVEAEPNAQLTLMMEADAQGMTPLGDMRTGTTKFIRIVATSDDLAGTAFPYKFQFDGACKVAEVGDFSDEDGVYAIEYTFDLVHDATWGKAYQAEATNKLTAIT